MWYNNATNQDCKALQRVVRLAERISGSALPSLQDIYLKRCRSRTVKIIKDSNHPGNHLFCLLPSGRRFRSMMAKTERLRRSFFPQAIRLLTQTLFHKHSQDPLSTVNIITFSSLLLYVHYHEHPSAHPSYSHYYLLSPSTLFFFLFVFFFFFFFVFFICTSYCFLDILWFFAHLFCTSYCLCTSYCFLHLIVLHILLLFLFFLPYVCPCVMLLYNLYSYYLHCPLSGPDSITFHF